MFLNYLFLVWFSIFNVLQKTEYNAWYYGSGTDIKWGHKNIREITMIHGDVNARFDLQLLLMFTTKHSPEYITVTPPVCGETLKTGFHKMCKNYLSVHEILIYYKTL